MGTVTDPNDPRLTHNIDTTPSPQAEVYLVLSEEERAKGYVRPVRYSYVHVGVAPKYPLRDLTDKEREQHGAGYVKFEEYPEDLAPLVGRAWTQAQLDARACGAITTMGSALAETYARDPKFYGATYCCSCSKHLPVGEFLWVDGGTVVGS